MEKRYSSLDTKLIHAGELLPRLEGAVIQPIFQSSTFEYGGQTSYHDLKYIRLNNTPNHLSLHKKLAALENAESALVMSSGMAAITTTLLTVLSSGDHLLAQDCLYGGTHSFLTDDLASFGISYDFIDGNDPDSWEEKLRPSTKAILVESITNPLLQVADLKAVVEFAREKKLVSMIDNTFASPVNFRPPELGFDLSLHSCTKYLNGHSDIVAGAVIGRRDLVEKIFHRLNHLGASLDPHACFLLQRGIKTLGVRVRFQNQSALQIARFLENHPAVEKVNYPGLESHPDHERAVELFDGFGGMLSFELKGGSDPALRFMEKTTLPIVAPSLGGVETLITRPVTTSHSGMSPQDREAMGITDALIRLSVGLESTEDLIEDFKRALT
ncbi:MAG: aminotransferase class I/II-fold pyridoxal phosphate-dependent enzyme [Deltaproteobacteria bacterium]|nr:aminotransferase class I/II-fold pyridoxal phosphate-dependent enzyme [Deltaproteobacteria bacterium]MBW2015923.1 aminotransferase class I/II-fold pyridoxal phosphate-dependent enzyme [Deltaproteobacteria bacterium]MBW2127963.1 aminotransferase class I/II-fold pyridoxal phosphate-dependent enzyme [Deltaproteobacteria bacterium]MBW2303227.1 aminotransferase class I/II-fold pyridoxal phosphate-dependent enzyme [Deltaproteobacteria bacterium]